MKMPEFINKNMFAPCGINCMACYKYCNSKKPCDGCYAGDGGKTKRCLDCNIKNCVVEKNIQYCFECENFPCKLVKNLEKRYIKYDVSLIYNSTSACEDGIEEFLLIDRYRWFCTKCGGVISQHEGICTECLLKIEDIHMGPYAEFGIIENFDYELDYGNSYEPEKYGCISIIDDIINDWWDGLLLMNTYFHCYKRPAKAFARWGISLIPPESIDVFIEIIKSRTSEKFLNRCKSELPILIALLEQAKSENKYVIHYGV